jgi:hypothetical protein
VSTIEFDNRAPENIKIVVVSDRAFRLWFNACCYCNRNLTDGRVPAALIQGLSVTATKRTVGELLNASLLERLDGDTFLVHDYLDHNPSRADVEEERRRSRERTAKWRSGQDVTRHQRITNGIRDAHVTIADKEESRTTEIDRATEKTLLVCDSLAAQILDRDPQASVAPRNDRWLREARLLLERDQRDPELVMQVLAWLKTDTFWSTVILSTPKLREKFTQLVAKMRAAEGNGTVGLGGRRETPSDLLRAMRGDAAA